MRIFKYLVLISIFLQWFDAKSQTHSDCVDEAYQAKCYEATQSIFENYIYLKSRPINKRMALNLKFSLRLRKNSLYLFNVCEGEASGIILRIYDEKNLTTPVATNYIEEEDRISRILSIYPKRSGTYFLIAEFSDGSPFCSAILQGMIRKNIESYIDLPEEK